MNRSTNIFLIVILLFLGMSSRVTGQFYTTGEDPGSISWKQLKTKNYQLVFPERFTPRALEYAHALDSLTKRLGGSNNFLKKRNIPVVFHPFSARSNGVVVWAPRRVEIFPVPPQDIFAQDWIAQLVLHEHRHVSQIKKLDQNFVYKLSYLIGQQAPGLALAIIPRWFLEGDAVFAETYHSSSGRGRLPAFHKEWKAILLQDEKLFPFNKAIYGSYHDHVPDIYRLGYPLVTYGRYKYGDEIWDNILSYTSRYPYLIIPFYFGLKKYGGTSKTKLYKESMAYMDSTWKKNVNQVKPDPTRQINVRSNDDYTNYRYAREISDSLFILEKSGIDQLDQLILMDIKGKENILHVPGNGNHVKLDAHGNKVIWTEHIPDPRWSHRGYSVVKSLDINSGKTRRITGKHKYFSPSFSPGGKELAVTEVTNENQYKLTVLDSETGETLHEKETVFYPVQPVWKNNHVIISAGVDREGKSLWEYNLKTGNLAKIAGPFQADISDFTFAKGKLWFRGTFTGTDNIYMMDTLVYKMEKITSSKLGAYYPYPHPRKNILYYSEYTTDGFNLVKMKPEKSEEFNPLTDSINYLIERFDKPKTNIDTSIVTDYRIQPYRKMHHLFNLHSWSPFYFDYIDLDFEDPPVFPGITLLSQNVLSTAITTAGYGYKNKHHFFSASFIYRGWYPVFKTSVNTGGVPYVNRASENAPPETGIKRITFNEEIFLPLNFTRSKYVRGIRPAIELNFSTNHFMLEDNSWWDNGIFTTGYSFRAWNYLKLSHRDIEPVFGQVLEMNYRHTVPGIGPFFEFFRGDVGFYLPGLARHHSFILGGKWQYQPEGQMFLLDETGFPRGYKDYIASNTKMVSTDYVMPIFYPDLCLGSIFYIKRIRGKFFSDWARIKVYYNPSREEWLKDEDLFRSHGMELWTDFHFLRIATPLSAGYRGSWKPRDESFSHEFLFSLDLTAFGYK